MELVRRRHFELGPRQSPWQVPAALDPDGATHCGEGAEGQRARLLSVPQRLGEIVYRERARLDLRVDRDGLDDDFPAVGDAGWLTQSSFPELVARIRAANQERFGRDADRP